VRAAAHGRRQTPPGGRHRLTADVGDVVGVPERRAQPQRAVGAHGESLTDAALKDEIGLVGALPEPATRRHSRRTAPARSSSDCSMTAISSGVRRSAQISALRPGRDRSAGAAGDRSGRSPSCAPFRTRPWPRARGRSSAGHGLVARAHAALLEQRNAAQEGVERPRRACHALVGLATGAVDRDLQVARRVLTEQIDVLRPEQTGVGEHGDQQAPLS
jgi:hypothetical protein